MLRSQSCCKSLLLYQNTKIQNAFFARFVSDSLFIKTDVTNGVKNIVMCNQKNRNALCTQMMQKIMDNIIEEKENQDVRVIVISAEGPVFSGGHNLKELADNTEKQKENFHKAYNLMMSIMESPVPVIAKVDGSAVAAGLQLVAQCDMALCSDKSKFSTPGANFGIFCSTPGIALARAVNKMPSLYMLLTGLPVSGQEAKKIGLVNVVCPSEKLDEEVNVVCDAIKTKSRDIIELGKKFYYKQIQCDIKEAYQLGSDKMVENLQMPDCREGIQSFIEKRKPRWNLKNDKKTE